MSGRPSTPFYFYDQRLLRERAVAARMVAEAVGARLLYSVKACAVGGVVARIAEFVDGFSCSSLFEVRAAGLFRRSKTQTLHFCAPAVSAADADRLKTAADYVTFNSLTQWRRFCEVFAETSARCGLRVNPELSFADDPRYDPCRPGSKLGIVASDIAACPPEVLVGITGLHFHNNADSTDLRQLAQTVDVVGRLPLERLSWLNIGGGYFPHRAVGLDALVDAVRRLRTRYELEIFFEPGAAFVREAGFLVTSVLDVFRSNSTSIVVLDSSVNHYPNFLTYGSTAHVSSPRPGRGFRYVLAGATCLAGDLFGELELDAPLNVGDAIVLEGVGAYGLVKMHMFNGVPLPDVYLRAEDGSLQLLNSATYGDYLRIHVGV